MWTSECGRIGGSDVARTRVDWAMAGAFVGADARVVWGKAGVLEDDGADAGRRRLTAFAVRAGAMI